MTSPFTKDDLWDVFKSNLEDEGLVQHHIKSFNYFVKEGLQELIKSIGEYEIKTKHGTVVVKFGQVFVDIPTKREIDAPNPQPLYPWEARLRNLTYEAPLYVKMSIFLDGKPLAAPENVWIGNIPVMVKSDICPLSKMSHDELLAHGEDPNDPGGYFIINGSERVIVAVEDLAPNRIIVMKKEGNGRPQYSAVVLSAAHGRQIRVEVSYRKDSPTKVYFSRIYKGVPAI
ncbi:MAG: DNA-directed RNA polymerase subunit B, partial [Candidatus Caldarchaeum sp.]|nr:DNA-directed RNA polymerase subunit B [Candidatus Caldarchaeum sp.]